MDEITIDKILEYKKKYFEVYVTEISGTEFLWRGLSRREFSIAMTIVDEQDREEWVCKQCVLYPENFDFSGCLAGIPTTIAIDILIKSGFGNQDTGLIASLTEKYSEEMLSFQHQISCIIHEAFNNLDLEEIEGWTIEKTLWYYSRAKYVLGNLRGLELVNMDVSESNESGNDIMNAKSNSVSGSVGDFPEMALQKAFMEGKQVF